MISIGGEVGLLPRLSVVALGQMGFGGEAPGPDAGAIAGLRFQLLPASMIHTHLVVSGGYLREAWAGPVWDDDNNRWTPGQPNGDNGAWVQAAFSQDIQRVRVASTVHGEHIFSQGRDALDIMVQAGASVRIVGAFRGGVEYVGQDLEESFSPGAEGGARHFLGPTASLQLFQNWVTMVAGLRYRPLDVLPGVHRSLRVGLRLLSRREAGEPEGESRFPAAGRSAITALSTAPILLRSSFQPAMELGEALVPIDDRGGLL